MFEGSFKSVSLKNFKGCFMGVCSVFQGYLKKVQREFQGRVQFVSRVFQENSKGGPRKI